jgi:hypothetical protein
MPGVLDTTEYGSAAAAQIDISLRLPEPARSGAPQYGTTAVPDNPVGSSPVDHGG